jgi:hypothetical protein
MVKYGGFADAIGGIATMVLAIVGLSGGSTNMMVAIATIVFGTALLILGGTMLSEYAHIIFSPAGTSTNEFSFSGGGLAGLFLVGAAGIVLGVLAVLGIFPVELTAIAVIAFGGALMLSSSAVWHLHQLKRSMMMARESRDQRFGSEILAGEMASGSAGIQALAGLAAVVLGILAVVGARPGVLTLIALLVLGTTIVMTGSAMSGTVLSFMRPSAESNGRSAISGA